MFIYETRPTVGIRAKGSPEKEKKTNDSGNRFREERPTIQGIVPKKGKEEIDSGNQSRSERQRRVLIQRNQTRFD